MTMAKKNALGRGLGALIEDPSSRKEERENVVQSEIINEININDIEINPFQPRSNFDEESLGELADSIKELGLIQPITVRKMDNGKFQLISGERRFRACKLAGMESLPAYTRKADDQNMLEMALVENIQREDLDSVEVAISFQRLIEECKLTQENLSERVGKKRSTISNYLRLLKLPAEIQVGIRVKKISMGHAKTLINLENTAIQLKVFDKIINNDLSVRKTEELVRSLNEKSSLNGKEPNKLLEEPTLPENLFKFWENMNQKFGKVDFKRSNKGDGKIIISFKSDDDLDKIINALEAVLKENT